ncbi:hypothetical protein JQ615_18785 [Bradyrhizobium jicamae]|uniref:Uncharacterized protein n=1 Tax=Bradyrhizobium jicamae TaxID=280332 RepID=A0ABS5FKW5_9BRAD|nr:hypothetical protein [Bradyrhizobium jicamae]MBR0797438.1 hypothetical protein [Bradyrhizobium jicamae]MBR0939155.1 hypothetical protein [Bradyrhizobium jicamae]
MRHIILALALLCPAAALAQGTTTTPTTPPPAEAEQPAAAQSPMIGGKPLVQVGKKSTAKKKKGEKAAAPGKPQSVAVKLQACQDIDDGTKDRLNCYDEIFKPEPKPKAPVAKGVNECRFMKEEDERLTCYNGFADKIPKLPR